MHAVLLSGHGGMEKLEYRSDVDVPIPKDDEVLINVKAAGINNTDINTRIGWYSKSSAENSDDGSWSGNPLDFPIIQGADICGNIVAVGKYSTSTSNSRFYHIPMVMRSILSSSAKCKGNLSLLPFISALCPFSRFVFPE